MPTIVTDASSYSNGWPGGQLVFQVQFDTYLNSGLATGASGVTIEVIATDASSTPVPTTSTGVVGLGVGMFQYTWNIGTSVNPGAYDVFWNGTRAIDSVTVTYAQTANVAMPYQDAAYGCYATIAQYRARTLDSGTPDATVQARLLLASEQIDAKIVNAVYATEADGMPLNAKLAVGLMNATIEQARYLNAKDDDASVKDEYQSISMAGISYTRAPNMVGSRMPRLSPQAKAILHNLGVLQGAPLVNW